MSTEMAVSGTVTGTLGAAVETVVRKGRDLVLQLHGNMNVPDERAPEVRRREGGRLRWVEAKNFNPLKKVPYRRSLRS